MPATVFGKKLASLRNEIDMSQTDLAKRSGISVHAIRALEQGKNEPGWTTVQKLALALGVDYTALETLSRKRK